MNTTLVRQGKVRDVYDLGEHYLMVATDRISAFDWILPTIIPDKGRILNQISQFWFDRIAVENHVVTTDLTGLAIPNQLSTNWLEGRSMVVRKCKVIPVECVVRGYLVGSGYKDYQKSGSVCGINLPPGLRNCERFEVPLFTPATKAESGHDENIAFVEIVNLVGRETAEFLRDQSIDIYTNANAYARQQGLILADTKFEWGWFDDRIILIDEVLTPDSSRYWPEAQYQAGRPQKSFDKQFVREYLESTGWDKNSDPPALPDYIVQQTREKYIEAYEIITKHKFKW